jgi:flavin reductase (DIM6/NTAB) family NADH-FMN oxidoreductase RutF
MNRTVAWMPKEVSPPLRAGPSAYLTVEQTLEAFREGMRRLAGAVTVVTTRCGEERFGLTVTAVCSLSATPPRILACVNVGGRSFKAISDSRCMAINVLGAHHEGVARSFASSKEDPFVGQTWTQASTGAPLLADALVSFDCEVSQMFITRSHALLIGDIRHIAAGDESDALLYMNGRFASLAPATRT